MKYPVFALILFGLLSYPAQARHRHQPTTYAASPECNVTMPCEGVSLSARGERVVKAMGGFGIARNRYTPTASPQPAKQSRHVRHHAEHRIRTTVTSERPSIHVTDAVVDHPAGCPHTAFCGCGAAVRLFGKPIRNLWLAANWFQFPKTSPAPGMAAVRRHHVMVLEADLGGGIWMVYDPNSGRHATRIHARSIAGYTIVRPHS
jgi:hypothetical protein